MLADLRIGLVSPLSNAFSGIVLSGSGSLENFTHLNVQPVPERELRYRIDAEGPSKEIVQIRKFRLWGEKTSLETSGYLRLPDLSGKGEVWLTVEDLKRVSRVFKADIPGSTKIHASFNGNARRRMFAARIEGQLNLPEASFTRISPLMGSNMRYAGQIRLADENNLTISSLQLDTETGKVTGTASLDLKHRELESDFKIVVPKLSSLSPVLTRTIDGSLEMDGVISGAFSSPAVSVNAEARNLLFEGLNFETVTAKLQTEGLPPSIQGRLEVALRYAGQVFSGSSGFSLQEERLGLTALSIKSKENELTGKLTLDLKSLLAEGKLQGNARKLSDLDFLFGEDLVGGAGIKTEFEIVNNKQKIGLDLRGWNLKSRFGHAEELNLRARLIDPFKKPSGNFALKGSGLRLGEVTLETLALAGEGTSEKISLHGKTTGKYTDSFEVETRGTLRATSKAQTLELNALGAHYGDLPLELRAPAAIYRTATGYRLETLSLRVGGGRLDGSGRLENRRLTLETDLKGLPLSDLPFSRVSRFTGSATGSLYVMGPIDRPQGSANLSLDALSLKDAKASDLPPATVNAQAELKKGRLKSHLTLQGLTAEPLKATLDIPLLFSFSPFVFSLPPTGEIWGNLDGDLDVERIHTLLGPDYQIVKGHFGVDFALTGTVDDPRITGQGKVGKGYYEYIPTGTVLRDAEVKITGDIPRVSIEAARATDGESGSVALEGWVDLVPGDRFPFQAALTFEQATLLRRDDINATVGGRAILAGSVEKAKLAGRIRAEHAEIRIPDRLPPNIADLQVIETRETTEEANRSPTPRVRRNLQLFLDLAVEGPGKIFVRGRGLDSEWKCDLHIAGTASEPKITGNLSVVRGRFNFLGKRFDIRQGSIAFNGDYPPSPVADIVTEARANDMTAELRLSGSLKDPELSLRSDPPLPSDEILSRVLFGRALTAITPFQALALADAARTLAGGGGGGFMEQTRSVLGVDQLEVSTDGEAMDQATVGAGKYLSDKVYLEVERGLDPQSSKARVQVEVTPNVTVESEVGANSEGGMGVRWKWDY
jgi:translocation and assembly module TamB